MISVIIPLYNVERFIGKCLESLENQIYKDFEVLVIDDGSTDKSAMIVNEYIEKNFLNIKLMQQKNAGVSVARNRGINEAMGDYLCFVDADDLIAPEYLNIMLNEFINTNCDLVFCGYKKVSEEYTINGFIQEKKGKKNINSYEALRGFLYQDFVSGVWSLMVKKKIINKNDIRFSEGFRYSEDLEFIWKMLANSKNITILNDELYIYRVRNGSAMSFVDNRRIDGFILIQGLETYFEDKCPDFISEYKRYGAARWVWATLWQAAISSNSLAQFMEESRKYNSKIIMRKLLTYPKFKVSIVAFVFCAAPFIYYYMLTILGKRFFYSRELSNDRGN